ncbi:uncharacterized protein LOC121810356 [Salvia splendens]|uniref:uncharacterized protein LOC121810356 n=1 Tax=Salvia splendens TaxID=180675 RepID=UPI001C25E2C6|nr:uncharacterized protein LOC121810356 [Salvia splendens]
MRIDPNNGWWPIAWAVTEAESYAQWKWFLEYLADDLNLHANGPRYVFMSDQQKGLAKLIVDEFPQSEHRFCVQHIYNNFKKRFVGENFKERLWEIASSTTLEQFICKMDALKTEYPQAHQWLSGVAPKEKWVKAFFSPHTCCDVLLNNICETFNSKIALAREKAMISMLEDIRTSQMERIQIRGQWIKSYDQAVPPVIKELLDKLWQITGIPCTHAIAIINKNGDDVARHVSRYYLKTTMVMLYENVLYPINVVDNWPKHTSDGVLELAPPRSKRQRGRPKKLRREEPQVRLHADGSESLRRTFVMKCRRCGQEGHNRRTCSNDHRTDARSQVGENSQHNGARETEENTLPKSSNNRRRHEPNVSDRGPSTRTRTRTRTQHQRCGRRGDQD